MKKNRYPSITLKGIAMGAADVVPGVSGGTIAFITGIYEELLNSIKNVDLTAVKLLFTFRFRAFWKKINGNFLLALVLGIGISIFTLARIMTWLLVSQPVLTWAFFFGLILASSLIVARTVPRWSIGPVVAILIGAATGYLVTALSPTTTPDTWWFVMLSGAIAICAMILPGISGSFILLLLGKYQYVMKAVSELNIPVLLVFAVGAVIGIVSFSHLLSWLLRKYNSATVALLTGFMLGSLNKVWPWKRVLETYTDSDGAAHPLVESNVWPGTYEKITGADPQLLAAIGICLFGFLLIYSIEIVSRRKRVSAGARAEKEQ